MFGIGKNKTPQVTTPQAEIPSIVEYQTPQAEIPVEIPLAVRVKNYKDAVIDRSIKCDVYFDSLKAHESAIVELSQIDAATDDQTFFISAQRIHALKVASDDAWIAYCKANMYTDTTLAAISA